ncbi:hypothetical protein MRX96_013532 [Rhipicephalus microplus]
MATKRLGNQHIQVFVRCRPPTASEKRDGSARAIEVDQERKEILFGPDAKQIDVYRAVMAPTIAEVMMGYNCTVFTSTQRRSSVFKGTPAATRYRNRISWTSSTIEWPESTTHRIASIFFWIIDRVSVIQSCGALNFINLKE